jgi:hypothetical protein
MPLPCRASDQSTIKKNRKGIGRPGRAGPGLLTEGKANATTQPAAFNFQVIIEMLQGFFFGKFR